MSKPFLEFDIADFSNTNTSNQTLAEIRRDAYTSGFIQGKADEHEEAYKQGREDAISEAISEISKYASVWMSYTDGMTKEQIAHEALNASKDAMIGILERMKERTDDTQT